MIEAKKSKPFEWLFHQFNKRLLRFHFEGIYIKGTTDTHQHSALFIANHSSWWDPLVCFYLNYDHIKHDSYAMMSEKGLTDFPFFKKIGCFSVQRDHVKDVVRSLTYGSKLLNENKSVWIFPQGDEAHLESRPLKFQSGAIYLHEKATSSLLIPVSYYYSFLHKRKPYIFVTIGESINYHDDKKSKQEKTQHLEEISTQQLDELRDLVIHERLDTFTKIL
ncbi:lysophospholipid acyltransferase family protein [Bacillus sp. DJP31]|uniref:lysophospholipid acyltransferase family protein n=1 Tax=Bacillus sp. DJP31 TaxID=3409789 RepID=UPI003BB66151